MKRLYVAGPCCCCPYCLMHEMGKFSKGKKKVQRRKKNKNFVLLLRTKKKKDPNLFLRVFGWNTCSFYWFRTRSYLDNCSTQASKKLTHKMA